MRTTLTGRRGPRPEKPSRQTSQCTAACTLVSPSTVIEDRCTGRAGSAGWRDQRRWHHQPPTERPISTQRPRTTHLTLTDPVIVTIPGTGHLYLQNSRGQRITPSLSHRPARDMRSPRTGSRQCGVDESGAGCVRHPRWSWWSAPASPASESNGYPMTISFTPVYKQEFG